MKNLIEMFKSKANAIARQSLEMIVYNVVASVLIVKEAC